ncbi:DUF1073 domain-containing protein [Xylella fastidiosa]|uniref:DUF1073 domain-containing protein n=1 Tax=Xylella fastidiosa TaxID=2371 RepID=UPI0009BDBF02|nr:DUF1073 domain-containing protein [Xylella fastidiosa]MDG5822421.1 DUF1073 domain-containing protein [Xylella fastidiosa subsp. pauca]MDG5825317.1 DUF1073 domain-containing protein [Xylella fastidiosa subsp. pauca]
MSQQNRNKRATRGAAPQHVVDTLQNLVAGLGDQRDKMSYGRYLLPRVIDRVELEAMYRTNWLARKIVDIPATDMTREWVTLQTCMQADALEPMYRLEQALNVRAKVRDALAWARLYGGAVLFINVHGQDPSLPFDPASVMPGTRLSLTVLDRWRVALGSGQMDQDPLSETYGQPRCYQIAGSVERVDRSRMIAFSGAELPWEAFRGNGYWHDSVLQAMYNALSRYDTATQGTASMFFEAVVDVLRISGLSDTLSSDQGTQEIHKRFQLAAMMKSFNRMLLLDAKDEYTQKTNHFAGVKEVIEQFMMDISGAADIPATRLFGQSPKGMNATGDSDIRNYYDRIKAQQEDELRPVLRVLYAVLFRASVGECPQDLEIQFNSLWQMSETERATIEKLRAERDQMYLAHGVIGPDVPCAELLEQKTYSKLTERDVRLAAELSQAMEVPDVLPVVETTAPASNT